MTNPRHRIEPLTDTAEIFRKQFECVLEYYHVTKLSTYAMKERPPRLPRRSGLWRHLLGPHV